MSYIRQYIKYYFDLKLILIISFEMVVNNEDDILYKIHIGVSVKWYITKFEIDNVIYHMTYRSSI